MLWKRNAYLGISVLILFAIFSLWSTRLSLGFIGSHDNHSAWVLLSAKNYLHYGYFNLGLAQYIDAEMLTVHPVNLYHNHPPFISLWLSFLLPLFGESELSTRMSVILPSLLSVAVVFQIAKQVFNRSTALFAIVFFVTSPVIAFYGQMLAHEQFIVLFYALASLSYLSLIHQQSTYRLFALAIFSGLAVLSGWGGYLCIGTIGLHSLIFHRRFRILFSITVGGIIGTLIWMIPGAMQIDGFFDTLYGRFALRSGQELVPWRSEIDYWWTMIWARIRPLYSESLLLLTGLGTLALLWQLRDTSSKQLKKTSFVISLFLPYLLYLIILKESAYRHDYTVYYLSLGAAIVSASFVSFLLQKRQELDKPRSRYLLGGLLLLFLVAHVASGIRWTRIFYNRSDDFSVIAGEYIRSHAPDEALVYANVDWWPALWYYAQKNVQPLNRYDASVTDPSMLIDCDTDIHSESSDLQSRLWNCDVDIVE